MPRTGTADLPLHGGSAPRWLFKRMVSLGSAISEVMLIEYGSEEFLRRLSDPYWFQALTCVLGFDWHSSGTTTVSCGALKKALKDKPEIAMAGGKGRASRKTLSEIHDWSEEKGVSSSTEKRLSYSSRLSAKVDNSALQDGHSLYHHSFLFDEKGNWATIQQGMAEGTGYARRYHWFSKELREFVVEPHSSIQGNEVERVLNMTSTASEESRKASVDLLKDGVDRLQRDLVTLEEEQTTLYQWSGQEEVRLNMPRFINWEAMRAAYEFQPSDYEDLISVKGIGPSTVRALALIGELIYGAEPSWRDPVKFSFTVGGKDGVPYPVDKKTMDESTQVLLQGIEEAKVERKDKLKAVERLRRYVPPDYEL